jgi:hypothetical protein
MTNRDKFLKLLAEFEISQATSAELIAKQTQRPCSPRTVRSWLNDPEKPSSRPCPDWAIEALEKQLKKFKRVA